MTLDLSPLSQGVDASTLLQAALDAGGPVDVPPVTLTLEKPVYLSGGCDLTGRGATLYAPNRDALVAMPAAQRNHDPAPHVTPNVIDPARWAFRSHGSAGLRFLNTSGDMGPELGDCWAGVRRFAVETRIVRHPSSGGVCGSAWWTGAGGGAGLYRPAPWFLYQHTDRPEHVDCRLAVAGKSDRVYRFRVGPYETDLSLVLRVDLDAGSVTLEVNGVVLSGADAQALAPVAPGDVLMDNPGAPLWLGCVSFRAGGICPPETGNADVTIHSFRIWKTATPPTGFSPFANHSLAAFVATFEAPPVAGAPHIRYVGEGGAWGWGYFVPTAAHSPGTWASGVRVRDLGFSGWKWGAGLTVISATDVDLAWLRIHKFAVGVQVLGGPLPNYPVRVTDLNASHQRDCAIRLQWCIARSLERLTLNYSGRSVVRADHCGYVSVRDLFHAGENAGAGNTVTDVLRFDGVHVVDVSGVLSNYEDGHGPRNSYVRITGQGPEAVAHVYRVKGFARQSLRPGARYIDIAGLAANAVGEVVDSF